MPIFDVESRCRGGASTSCSNWRKGLMPWPIGAQVSEGSAPTR